MDIFLIRVVSFSVSIIVPIIFFEYYKNSLVLPFYFYNTYLQYFLIIIFFLSLIIQVISFHKNRINLVIKLHLFVSIALIIIFIISVNNINNHKDEIMNPEHEFISLGEDEMAVSGRAYIGSSVISDSLPTIVIWGDSHAGMLQFSKNIFNKYNIHKLSTPGCPGLIGTIRRDGVGNHINCDVASDKNKILEKIIDINPDIVVLINRYSNYLHGYRKLDRLTEANQYLYLEDSKDTTLLSRMNAVHTGLLNSINFIKSIGSKCVILKPLPDLQKYGDPQKIFFEGIYQLDKHDIEQESFVINSIIDNVSDNDLLVVDSKLPFLIDGKLRLFNQNSNDALYSDDNHLSKIGSVKLTDYIIHKINNKWESLLN